MKMTNRVSAFLLALGVAGLMFAGSAAAQNSSTSTTTTSTTQTTPAPTSGAAPAAAPTENVGPGSHEQGHSWENHVNNREQDQQNRIANGIKDGQLSAGQAAQLEKRQQAIQNQEAKDEAAHNGHLTPQEKAKLQREQNHQSRKIRNERNGK
jgi:hypothetical protein